MQYPLPNAITGEVSIRPVLKNKIQNSNINFLFFILVFFHEGAIIHVDQLYLDIANTHHSTYHTPIANPSEWREIC